MDIIVNYIMHIIQIWLYNFANMLQFTAILFEKQLTRLVCAFKEAVNSNANTLFYLFKI